MSARRIEAFIFDLDGVLVATDDFHLAAWRRLAVGEGLHFNERLYNLKMRGVSRLQCLDYLLDDAGNRGRRVYDARQRAALAARKNEYYRELVRGLTPDDVLPGSRELLRELRGRGIKTAIGSSSCNARLILKRTALTGCFDAIVDGTDITRTKPDPEVFLRAAQHLDVPPRACVVLEDAPLGVEAGRRAGMRVIGIGRAARRHVHLWAPNLAKLFARLAVVLPARTSDTEVGRYLPARLARNSLSSMNSST